MAEWEADVKEAIAEAARAVIEAADRVGVQKHEVKEVKDGKDGREEQQEQKQQQHGAPDSSTLDGKRELALERLCIVLEEAFVDLRFKTFQSLVQGILKETPNSAQLVLQCVQHMSTHENTRGVARQRGTSDAAPTLDHQQQPQRQQRNEGAGKTGHNDELKQGTEGTAPGQKQMGSAETNQEKKNKKKKKKKGSKKGNKQDDRVHQTKIQVCQVLLSTLSRSDITVEARTAAKSLCIENLRTGVLHPHVFHRVVSTFRLQLPRDLVASYTADLIGAELSPEGDASLKLHDPTRTKSKHIAAAARLLLALDMVDPIDPAAVMKRLVQLEVWDLLLTFAERVARHSLDGKVAEVVEMLYAQDRERMAFKLVRATDLHHRFPDARRLHMRAKIERFVEKNLFDLAAQAATSGELQLHMIDQLLEHGHVSKAHDYCRLWGLQDKCNIDQQALQAFQHARKRKFLALPAELLDTLLFVRDAEELARAREVLLRPWPSSELPLVGMDCEWRPVMPTGARPKPAAPAAATATQPHGEADSGANPATENANRRRNRQRQQSRGAELDGDAKTEACSHKETVPRHSEETHCEGTEKEGQGKRNEERGKGVDDGQQSAAHSTRTHASGSKSQHQQQQQQQQQRHTHNHRKQRVSIFQLARHDALVILDLLSLEASTLEPFMRDLLHDQSIIKVGFAFDGDLKMLRKSFPEADCFRTVRSLLDLQPLRHAVTPAGATGGLKDLVHRYMHKPLDKTEQMSNWNRRPLTSSQLHYAALDAHVCVSLAEKMLRTAHANNISKPRHQQQQQQQQQQGPAATGAEAHASAETRQGNALLQLAHRHASDVKLPRSGRASVTSTVRTREEKMAVAGGREAAKPRTRAEKRRASVMRAGSSDYAGAPGAGIKTGGRLLHLLQRYQQACGLPHIESSEEEEDKEGDEAEGGEEETDAEATTAALSCKWQPPPGADSAPDTPLTNRDLAAVLRKVGLDPDACLLPAAQVDLAMEAAADAARAADARAADARAADVGGDDGHGHLTGQAAVEAGDRQKQRGHEHVTEETQAKEGTQEEGEFSDHDGEEELEKGIEASETTTTASQQDPPASETVRTPTTATTKASGGTSLTSGTASLQPPRSTRSWHHIKSLAFTVQAANVVLILEASVSVNKATIAQDVGVRRQAVRLATPDDCVRVFGYVPGTMPPLGHRQPFPTVIDELLAAKDPRDMCVFGGGDLNTRLVLPLRTLLDIVQPTVFPLSQSPKQHRLFEPGVTVRFITDPMLSRLVRWLRCAGVDVEMCREYGCRNLIQAARATGRIVLTCSPKYAQQMNHVRHYLCSERDVKDQFMEVMSHFQLVVDGTNFMSRCTKCNGTFVHATPADVRGEVPEAVRRKIGDFWRCSGCGLVVWQGEQYRKVKQLFREFYGPLAHALPSSDNEDDGEQ